MTDGRSSQWTNVRKFSVETFTKNIIGCGISASELSILVPRFHIAYFLILFSAEVQKDLRAINSLRDVGIQKKALTLDGLATNMTLSSMRANVSNSSLTPSLEMVPSQLLQMRKHVGPTLSPSEARKKLSDRHIHYTQAILSF